jgi:hypothetical protein
MLKVELGRAKTISPRPTGPGFGARPPGQAFACFVHAPRAMLLNKHPDPKNPDAKV